MPRTFKNHNNAKVTRADLKGGTPALEIRVS